MTHDKQSSCILPKQYDTILHKLDTNQLQMGPDAAGHSFLQTPKSSEPYWLTVTSHESYSKQLGDVITGVNQ